MRFERKKGIKKVRIQHNKKLFWVIILLLAILIFLIYFIAKQEKTKTDEENGGEVTECKEDSDCVPATCCHPTECVNIKDKPDCSEIFCTMVCSGPLDCGAGNCGCVKGKCEIIKE